ncbi:MAG: hypothetical protein WCE82_01910 [Halobacteriota archaeon]
MSSFALCVTASLPYSVLSVGTNLASNGSKLAEVVGVAVAVGVAVGAAVGVVVGVAVGTLLADGLGLVVAGDVQPLIDTRTREPIKSNGNAYLSGVLIYRFIILVIAFTLHPPYK